MLLKVVCVTNASLPMHSNVIEELQKFHKLAFLAMDSNTIEEL